VTTSDDKTERSSTGFRRWMRLLPEVAILALCIPLWVASAEWTSSVGGPGPAFYPRLLILLLVLAMAVRLVHEVMAIRRGVGESEDADEAMEEGVEMDPSLIDMRRVAVVILLSVGYVVASLFLGWVLATFVLVPVFLWLTGRRNLLITVPLALLFSLGMAFVFVKIVYIALPTGVGVFDQFTVLLYELLGIY
jgi:hypothetical protein